MWFFLRVRANGGGVGGVEVGVGGIDAAGESSGGGCDGRREGRVGTGGQKTAVSYGWGKDGLREGCSGECGCGRGDGSRTLKRSRCGVGGGFVVDYTAVVFVQDSIEASHSHNSRHLRPAKFPRSSTRTTQSVPLRQSGCDGSGDAWGGDCEFGSGWQTLRCTMLLLLAQAPGGATTSRAARRTRRNSRQGQRERVFGRLVMPSREERWTVVCVSVLHSSRTPRPAHARRDRSRLWQICINPAAVPANRLLRQDLCRRNV